MSLRSESLANFLDYYHNNQNNDEQISLYTKKHNVEDLTIFTYGNIRKWKQISSIDACRGLILDKNFNVVSRGFDRFIPKFMDQTTLLLVKRATIKEDGSLMFMFKYNNKWMLSTMHDFADNNLPFANFTYEQLFMQIINQPLDKFAESLINQFPVDTQIMTFCFEMCSLENKVIRKYTTPSLYLLTAFGHENANVEIKISKSIQLPPHVHHVKEIAFPEAFITYEQAVNMVKKISADDFTFEGFVLEIITETGIHQRIKIKNPYYLAQHILAYRGLPYVLPKLLVPLIVENMDKKIYENVIDSLDEIDKSFTSKEILNRINYCKLILAEEYENLSCAVKKVTENIGTDEIKISKKDYVEYLQLNYKEMFDRWKGFFIDMFEFVEIAQTNYQGFLNIFNNIFKNYVIKPDQIKRIFKYDDPFIDNNHGNKCCELTEEIANVYLQNLLDNGLQNDGMSLNSEICYCGHKMKIIRLRSDFSRYRKCHCGKAYGYLTYFGYNYLGVCTSTECLCTHEVNSLTIKPLGNSCMLFCKDLRLCIHEIMDNIISEGKFTKSDCYDTISKIINKPKKDTHMAKLGVTDCLNIIVNLKKEMNKINK